MEEEEEHVSEGSREWERIYYSPQQHHRSPSDLYNQFNGWSMVAVGESHFDDYGDRSLVFPPINHEGLHISSITENDDQQQGRKPPFSPPKDDRFVPPSPRPLSSETSFGIGSEVVRLASFGFELLRSKLTNFVSSIRYFATFGGSKWAIRSPAALATLLLICWLFAVVRRRIHYLWVHKESMNYLIRLLREKDEKINQLLHQIAQMNQVLLSLHRESLSGAGGLVK